jgi:hypothetical protein
MVPKIALALGAGLLILALATGCGPLTGDADDGDVDEYVSEPAPIDEAEIIVRDSDPPGFELRFVAGIPSGCHEFEGYELSQVGSTINVTVTNLRIADPDAVCTMIYGMHEEIVDLGTDFDPGTEYTVDINDGAAVLKFTGDGQVLDQNDNDDATWPADGEHESVVAPIDGVELLIRESLPPQYALEITVGLPDACHSFESAEVARSGDTITVRVTNSRLTGDVACAQVYGQHVETVELGTDFEPGTEYTVHVNDETLTFTAQ